MMLNNIKHKLEKGLLQAENISTALLASIPSAPIQPIFTQNPQKNHKILSHTVQLIL